MDSQSNFKSTAQEQWIYLIESNKFFLQNHNLSPLTLLSNLGLDGIEANLRNKNQSSFCLTLCLCVLTWESVCLFATTTSLQSDNGKKIEKVFGQQGSNKEN